jgi:hypothetical protein
MENQTTLEPQQQFENEQLIDQELPPQPAKNNKLLLIGLSVISIISISLAGFFGYKYYQTDMVVTPSPTPAPIVMEKNPTTPPPAKREMEQEILVQSPTPTVDPTENWETYNHKTVGYSIKYPNDVEIKEREASLIHFLKLGPTQRPETELFDGLSISIDPREIAASAIEYANGQVKNPVFGPNDIIEKPRSTTVNGYPAATYTTSALGIHRTTVIQNNDKNMLYIITDSSVDPTKQGFLETANQIISTFKFSE